MSIQQILGFNLKQFREAKGWSQDKLSEESGIHRTYISDIERGVRNPTIAVVQKVALSLRVSVADLFKVQVKR